MKRLFTVFASLLTQGAKVQKTKMMYVVMTIVMMVFAPQGVKADLVTDAVYDFSGSAYGSNGNDGNMTTEYSSETIKIGSTTCTYFQTLGNVSNPGRFAAQVTTFSLRKSSGNNPTYGLNLTEYGTNQYRMFAITGLNKGSIVTVEGSANFDLSSGSNSANINGNKYTMTEQGSLALSIPGRGWIYKITIQHDDAAYWAYDPAIESYDLYWVNKNTEISTSDAGFALNVSGENAQYLSISSPTLNNRIAISQKYSAEGHHFTTDELWTFGRDGYGDESQGLLVKIGWNNLSICNLKEGDRVRLTLSGQATFSSKGQNGGYDGCSAFKDINCNGDQDEGEVSITPGLPVESPNNNGGNYKSYFYTITEDGHLDIGLSEGSRLCQVEIYADHQAKMIDRDNALDSKTSYFDTTGQLEAKHHIVPGGLHVYIGNDSPNEHAEVVMSDKGPVSFVYDYNDENSHHYKMARHSVWGSINVWSGLPTTGTYYKFVPEVTGKMWVKFKAANLTYYNYGKPGNVAYNDDGTPNEKTMNVYCPYYLMVEQNGSFQQVENPHYYANGADGYFGSDNGNPTQGTDKGITVEAGKTYYLYGWWQDGTDLGQLQNYGCGVAELIEVTFLPNQYISPLAKWVDSKTTSDDDLASVTGYTTVTVKKKSDNIASCTAKIEGGKLKISNITFVDENKGGGTILLKVGDPNNDGDPVFAYTIAYNAGYNQPEGAVRSEGHTWDFSTNPLNGLKWNNKNAEADVTSFGTRFNNFATADKDDNGIPTNGVNNSSLLTEEINKGDWTFNYRVKKNGQFHDPRFLNNYDMEGDNADMMWDTEGLIINAGSTQSCIFNEFGGTVAHTEDDDPDRYVGFLPGSELIIPKLKKNDRVIIYMGSGDGSGSESMRFNITNALDAMHKSINSEYWAGGSMWNTYDAHNDPYYRGCYHFYAAADGDMEFEMTAGSMCKIYSIQIYRGDRIETNEAHEAGKGYFLLSTKGDANGQTNSWNLHYRGKGERIAADAGSGKYSQKNEVIAKSGNITNTTLTSNTDNNLVSYTNNVGEFGMLRIRMKCMEFNSDYVTDFADRNITVAYHETMDYPYTWDFTDMRGFSNDAIEGEVAKSNYSIDENSTAINSWENASERDLSLWDENGMKVNSQISDPHNYNYIFEHGRDFGGHQLWAGNSLIPETRGLWFYMENNGPIYNGNMKIMTDGLHLVNGSNQDWWNYKMVIPSVPANAAVYLRMARDKENVPDGAVDVDGDAYLKKSFQWGTHYYEKGNYIQYMTQIADATNCRFYQVDPSDENSDWIVALKNTSGATSNLILQLNGYVLKKLSVSTDPKAIGKTGYATESRARDIDHYLTSYLTGKPIKAYTATITADYDHVVLSQVGAADNGVKIMPAATNGDTNGCILYHDGGTANSDGTTNRTVSILDGGFHVFVPDMHDKIDASLKASTAGNVMKSFNPVNDRYNVSSLATDYLAEKEGNNTNLILTAKKYKVGTDGSTVANDGYDVFFVRVDPNGNSGSGAKLKDCSAYIQIPTKDMVKLRTSSSDNGAKMSIVFADDWFGEINNGIATGIDQVTSNKSQVTSAEWYNLNGQKLNGMPTEKGLYIVKGRKVLVK